MSDSNNSSFQQNLLYALAGAVVVLLVVVGILFTRARTDSTIPSTNVLPSGDQQQPMAPQQQQAAPFDPKTATKVTAGQKPEEHVKAYYEACASGKYADAFKLLPKDKQGTYGSAKQFEEQLKGYGITGYELDKGTTSEGGKEFKITAWQKTGFGQFGYEWVLVKEGEDWLVKSREQAGMR